MSIFDDARFGDVFEDINGNRWGYLHEVRRNGAPLHRLIELNQHGDILGMERFLDFGDDGTWCGWNWSQACIVRRHPRAPAWALPYIVRPDPEFLRRGPFLSKPDTILTIKEVRGGAATFTDVDVWPDIDRAISATADDIEENGEAPLCLLVGEAGQSWVLNLETAAIELLAERNARADDGLRIAHNTHANLGTTP